MGKKKSPRKGGGGGGGSGQQSPPRGTPSAAEDENSAVNEGGKPGVASQQDGQPAANAPPAAVAVAVARKNDPQVCLDSESRQSLHLGGCLLSVLIFSIAHALNKPLPSLLDKPAWADDVITAGIVQTDATYVEVAKAGAVVLVWSVLPGERESI